MGTPAPVSVAEFRRRVPLTKYDDYAAYFLNGREDVLPVKPAFWMRTSGPSGEYRYKWVPVSEPLWYDEGSKMFLASLIFACLKERGEFPFLPGDRILFTMAPRPYMTGWGGAALLKEFPFRLLPPEEIAETLSFEERIRTGFDMALHEGLDAFFGVSSVLVSIGRRFGEHAGRMGFSKRLLHPRIFPRLLAGMLKAKMAGRQLLPKDLWELKGIVTAGVDTSIYKEQIEYYWGKKPLEIYAATDILIVAMQTSPDYEGMTFVPNINFLEFIPEQEALRSLADPDYQPYTVLLDELEAGKRYELVVTTLRGGGFIRYRSYDIIRIISMRNERWGIDIPQMVFETRIDDVIDIAGFTRLTEKVLWGAIENTRIGYEDWIARKEVQEGKVALHLYIEPKTDREVDPAALAEAIHNNLKLMDEDYRDLEEMVNLKPIRVTLLPPGSFHRYIVEQKEAGADLTKLRPPHINPSEESVYRLLGTA